VTACRIFSRESASISGAEVDRVDVVLLRLRLGDGALQHLVGAARHTFTLMPYFCSKGFTMTGRSFSAIVV
jgi:hypothetical protein